MKHCLVLFLVGMGYFIIGCDNKAQKHNKEITVDQKQYHETEDVAVLHGLGDISLETRENLDKEIEVYKEAIRVNLNDAMAHYNLGEAYAQQGRLDEAIVALKKAIEINPNDATAHGNLGMAYGMQGKFDEAITHYKELVRLARNNPALRNSMLQAEQRIQELK